MSNIFSLFFSKRRLLVLWLAWWKAVQTFRPACRRLSTFLWLATVLAAICLRPDLAGVTSLMRSLGLLDGCYPCLLHFFHSNAQAGIDEPLAIAAIAGIRLVKRRPTRRPAREHHVHDERVNIEITSAAVRAQSVLQPEEGSPGERGHLSGLAVDHLVREC